MKRTLLAIITAITIIAIGTSSINAPKRLSYSDGTSVSGFSTGCNGCHNTGAAGGSITLTGLPATVSKGVSYPISVVIAYNKGKRWGFDMAASTGTLTTTNPNAALTGTKNVHHGTSAPVATATSYTFDNITWKAPTTTGTVTFNLAGNAANNDGTTNGDNCYTSTFKATIVSTTPVSLSSFSAAAVGSKVLVSWATSTEINTNHFEVERSLDGKTFSLAAKVEATGNSTQTEKYSYSDNAGLLGGNVYYRLKSVDNDGGFSYSDVKTVSLVDTKSHIANLYPNPVKVGQDIRLDYVASKPEKVIFQLITVSGKTVYTTTINMNEGNNDVALKVGNLTTGLYYLSASVNGASIQKLPLIVN